jgi:dipeptidase D
MIQLMFFKKGMIRMGKKLLCMLFVAMVAVQAGAEKVPFSEVYKNLKPTMYWQYFKEISAVPRPSGHMEQIIQYMKKFAKKNGITDITITNGGNVIMRIPATKGYENRQMLTLQAHMDLVPAKVEGSKHNFETDPIKLFVDGDWVLGDGTNIGADDGMGVAEILTIFADKTLKHGPLEAVLTTDEEIGLIGATKMEAGSIKGDYILNLDGGPCMGCAGGITTDAICKISMDKAPENSIGIKVELAGLKGGHSGGVQGGMANAIKELANILYNLNIKYNINLVSINGGTARNAVPSKCTAIITINADDKDKVIADLKDAEKALQGVYFNTDPDLVVRVAEVSTPKEVINKTESDNIIKVLVACFNGVFRINNVYKVTETSTNIGIIKTDTDKILVTSMQRSAAEYTKKEIANIVAAPFELIGAKITRYAEYPSWQPQPDSAIVKLVTKAYKEVQDKDIKFRVSHGGFECGILASKGKKGLAAATIGANASGGHTPEEKLSIKSVQEQHDIVLYVIENMPVKGNK